jgi:hypothetical protein
MLMSSGSDCPKYTVLTASNTLTVSTNSGHNCTVAHTATKTSRHLDTQQSRTPCTSSCDCTAQLAAAHTPLTTLATQHMPKNSPCTTAGGTCAPSAP